MLFLTCVRTGCLPTFPSNEKHFKAKCRDLTEYNFAMSQPRINSTIKTPEH